jgi:putative SOS response-associated peptidase YedK
VWTFFTDRNPPRGAGAVRARGDRGFSAALQHRADTADSDGDRRRLRREPGSNRPDREAHLARWGLLPSWVKDPKDFPLLINARSETAAEKASFRAAMRHRRALIPASGFYEWKRDKASGRSQAYWVRPADGGLVAFAGLAETWMSAGWQRNGHVAILTVVALHRLHP